MWIARDKNGALSLFFTKPCKIEYWEIWFCVDEPDYYVELPCKLFPETKWEDEEPTEVILKVVENHESNIF